MDASVRGPSAEPSTTSPTFISRHTADGVVANPVDVQHVAAQPVELLGGDVEALCSSGVVGQHIGAIAYRVGAADPSDGDVDTEQGGVAVTRHERRASGWVEGQAADAVVAA
jgi:hypothetical protein